MIRPRVFLDFSVDDVPIGRVILELFNDSAPKTCENFRALCTGEKGLSSSGNPLYYKNSIVHRSIRGFMIQAGDFTKRNGSGGESIYGGPFPDEDLTRPLDAEGLLCMANKGPDTNGSQFFITLRECAHLNGKHVVFGRVIRGYTDIVKKLADVPVDERDRPTKAVLISNCGELELRNKGFDIPQITSTKLIQSTSGNDDGGGPGRHRSKRSLTPDGERPRIPHKKAKHKKRSEATWKDEAKTTDDEPNKETEEEYDARLEKEEVDRLDAERRKELERLKRRYDEVQTKDGVRFKGRGRMKFVDPEVSTRQQES